MKYVLTVTGSNTPETVSVSFQGDMFIFNGVPVGSAAPVTSLPVRLPFIVSRELVELSSDSQKIVAQISKPGTTQAVTIPITC